MYENKTFSLTIFEKDKFGKPTKKIRNYSTDSAYKLWKFWVKYDGNPKRKKRKDSRHLPNAQEAEKILQSLYEH